VRDESIDVLLEEGRTFPSAGGLPKRGGGQRRQGCRGGQGDRVAHLFVREDPAGPHRAITYAELLDEVCRAANTLRELGIGTGDTVGMYMGIGPSHCEAVTA